MSMSIASSLTIALRALSRNKLQTALTTVGMTIGVATVLTMIALGTGAEAAIEQQVRAAGMNLIVVTAGNYKAKTEDDGGGVVDHQARMDALGSAESLALLRSAESLALLRSGESLALRRAGESLAVRRSGTARDLRSGTPRDLRSETARERSETKHRTWMEREPVVVEREPVAMEREPVAMEREPRVMEHDSVVVEREPFRRASEDRPAPRLALAMFHPEDDPMEKHDHPTARQRLGDTEAGLGAAATLTPADADAIRALRGVQYVSEGIHENVHATAGDRRWFTRLHGGDVELPSIRRSWTFTSGRFFSAREQSRLAPVVVLGAFVAQKLFGDANPVGRQILLWKQPFEVVGVVSSGSWMVAPAAGDDQFDAVYVPFTTIHRLLNLSKLNDITITAASTGEVTRVSKDVTELLRARHRIGIKDPDDFTVATQARQSLAKGGLRPDVARAVVGNVGGLEKVTLEQLGRTLDRATKTMTALLGSIAAVSLLVGGIGIMNIMLLSVTERTREIGIRRAVGARAGDVLRQFLAEAIALSVIGGLAGIALGAVTSGAIAQMLKWSASVSPASVALSFAVAAAVGVFFGYYPARQASRLDPIESLRYE
jgi:putative ABC transport system permease protein